MKISKNLFIACLLAVGVVGISSAQAVYPNQPVKIIMPWPAGGGSDVVARALAVRLGAELKQPVIMDNRPGANGAIGTTAGARAPADGYTLTWATADTHSMNPHVYEKLGYDSLNDFAPIGPVGYFPYALIVSASFPASTVTEFISEAKKRPGQITFASWGIGGSAHVGMELFKQYSKFDVLHVPFTGAAPAITAVLGGQVDSMIVPMSVAVSHVASGKVKVLGLAAPKRFAAAPGMKTFVEQGVNLEIGTWVGLMAPKATPEAVVNRLNAALAAALGDPVLRNRLIANMNVDPASPQTPAQFAKFAKDDYEHWGKVIKNAGVQAK